MKSFLAFILGVWLIFTPVLYSTAQENKFVYPAEWEPHQSLWMGFRTYDEGLLHEALLQQMIQILTRHVHINLVVENPDLFYEKNIYLSMLEINPSRITVQFLLPVDFWFRDSGPFFLVNSKGQKAIASFRFNNYQNSLPESETEKNQQLNSVDQKIAQKEKIPAFSSDIVLEGGAFEVNGKGTILLSSLILKRNPGKTRSEIEKEILFVLGQKNAIWLDQGIAQDPLGFANITQDFWGQGTGGHVDEFARFVDPNTILLAWVQKKEKDTHPINRINYQRMNKNYQILSQAKDQDHHPFTIIKIPLPEVETQARRSSSGKPLLFVPAASYLNFLITNNLVLIPQYWKPGKPDSINQKDDAIKSIMISFFPKRQILQINPESLNQYGGGMHCIYQQEPKVSK